MSLTAESLASLPSRAEERVSAACMHCGSPIPANAAGRFCCGGCAAAYAFVHELGLDRYYATRALDRAERAPRPPEETAEDAALCAIAVDAETSSLSLSIDGLHCAACVWLIEQVLARDPAVTSARVNLTSRQLAVRWRGGPEIAARLVEAVRRIGYRAIPFRPDEQAGAASEEQWLLRALAVAGFAMANVMLLSVAIWSGYPGEMGPATRDLLHWISALIALPALAYAGRPFFASAYAALRAGRTNMDVPISIGVTLAAALSLWETARSAPDAYFESVVMLLFFLLIGRYLDRRARGRAQSAAEHLARFSLVSATVLDESGTPHRVPSGSLRAGDLVLVAAGERVPADGRVATGRSSVDRSLVDGESLPHAVDAGSEVLAGMLNVAAPLRISVTAVGERTFLAEVVRLMEAAERGRARLVALSDRVARRYAPAVHGLALATFLGWVIAGPWQAALLNAVSVLIITCPCALGLAVPVVQVIGTNRLFRRGILLKSATALERLAVIDTVVLDKTGTLTVGRPELRRDPAVASEDLEIAAGLAANSRHPLSRALQRALPPVAARPETIEEHPGEGLRAIGGEGEIRLGSRRWCGVADAAGGDTSDMELWLVRSGRAPTQFRFQDSLRPAAAVVVAELKASGKRVMLISGDRRAAVAPVAQALGIDEWQSDMSPRRKCETLDRLREQGAKVLMVGDGLNDGPALSAAYVSMSPATAADVCRTAADLVFQGASLDAVVEAWTVARRSRALVRENIGFAIAYNLAAVPLAIAGFVTPLLAAAAMSCSSILVVLNSLRLGRAP